MGVVSFEYPHRDLHRCVRVAINARRCHRQEKVRAARLIQRGYRGHRHRVEVVKIQSWYRGCLERTRDDVYDRLRKDHALLRTMKTVLWGSTETFFDTPEAYATHLAAAGDVLLRMYKALARQSKFHE